MVAAAVRRGSVPVEVSLRGARSCYNESVARGRARRAGHYRVGLGRAGLRAVLRAVGKVLAGLRWRFPVVVRPVGLTLRAADAATPRASRGGFRAKVLRLPGWLDGTAAPLTPPLAHRLFSPMRLVVQKCTTMEA